MKIRLLVLIAVLTLLVSGAALADEPQPVPPLTARVMDLSGTLTEAERSQIDAVLQALEAQKGAQVVVLIVRTTAPEDIAGYGVRVAHSWQLGRKGVDDGVLLLIAKDDRALRIEVGYGLEGAIPDAISKRIIEEIILPLFRDGKFFEGVQAGVNAIVKLVSGEELPPPSQSSGSGDNVALAFILFCMLAGPLQAIVGRFGAGAILGGGAFMFLISVLPGIYSAVIAAAIFFITLFADFSKMASGGRAGGISRGGSWSGGGGGGGFRGGGGGFGGGGASGRW